MLAVTLMGDKYDDVVEGRVSVLRYSFKEYWHKRMGQLVMTVDEDYDFSTVEVGAAFHFNPPGCILVMKSFKGLKRVLGVTSIRIVDGPSYEVTVDHSFDYVGFLRETEGEDAADMAESWMEKGL